LNRKEKTNNNDLCAYAAVAHEVLSNLPPILSCCSFL